MRVHIVGGGGREHTLAWKLAQSPQVAALSAAPGNAGIAQLAACHPVAATDLQGQIDLCRRLQPDLVVVAPDDPLALGLVDRLSEAGFVCFGPRREAARLEWSKAFAKEVMAAAGVPTAAWAAFTEYDEARCYLHECGAPVVVKADGLALGKGVMVCQTLAEADAALHQIMVERAFGAAGDRVIIEEMLAGQEVSVLAFTDGATVVAMPPSQDHKRIGEGDTGPNTGGMGTYTPVPVYTTELHDQVMRTIMQPVVREMRSRGAPFQGCLYAGIILTERGPMVLEFNARFGDPETQVVLPLLESDLAAVMLACARGTLAGADVRWTDGAAVCVVMASGGYPGAYAKGKPIAGLADAQAAGCLVFHAGTAQEGEAVVTAGGRVLGVVGLGADLAAARAAAYRGAEQISFDGAYLRRDIALRALAR